MGLDNSSRLLQQRRANRPPSWRPHRSRARPASGSLRPHKLEAGHALHLAIAVIVPADDGLKPAQYGRQGGFRLVVVQTSIANLATE